MRNITKAKITLLTAVIFQIRITLERNNAKDVLDMFISVGVFLDTINYTIIVLHDFIFRTL